MNRESLKEGKRHMVKKNRVSRLQKSGFYVFACLISCILATNVFAGDPLNKEDPTAPNPAEMHKLATKPPLPRAHKDFSQYRFCPPGDRIQEQADINRLLFWTPDGRPDGYAQRRGGSIIYYNAQGQAIRVQHLTHAELHKN